MAAICKRKKKRLAVSPTLCPFVSGGFFFCFFLLLLFCFAKSINMENKPPTPQLSSAAAAGCLLLHIHSYIYLCEQPHEPPHTTTTTHTHTNTGSFLNLHIDRNAAPMETDRPLNVADCVARGNWIPPTTTHHRRRPQPPGPPSPSFSVSPPLIRRPNGRMIRLEEENSSIAPSAETF